MTITCSMDHERRYMVAIASGGIALEDVRRYLHEEHFAGGLSYTELIDGSAALPTWSSAQAREIVTLLTTIGRESAIGPTAVVVSSEFAFGLLRMLEILLEGICIVKPFHDYAVAEQWLVNQQEAGT